MVSPPFNSRRITVYASSLLVLAFASSTFAQATARPVRAGMIGLDTSHVIAFTKLFNDENATGPLANVQIVAGYPGGTDMPSSRDRVKNFTNQVRDTGREDQHLIGCATSTANSRHQRLGYHSDERRR